MWNKLDNMNEQLAIKRSLQLQSLFSGSSSNDLANEEPKVRWSVVACSLKVLVGLLSAALPGTVLSIMSKIFKALQEDTI